MAVVRRGLFVRILIIAACMAVMPSAPAHAQGSGTPVVVFDGKGDGHGVGLAQWGAKYMADAGATHEQILSTFYPGTALTTVRPSNVRVSVFTSPDGSARLNFPNGGEVRSAPSGGQAAGFPVPVAPGGTVRITYDGAYHVDDAVTAQAAGGPAMWNESNAAGQVCDPV